MTKIRKIEISLVVGVVLLITGCEDNRSARCEAKCPKCGAQCVFQVERENHTDPAFNGNKFHKCGVNEGTHVWDFNGKYIGILRSPGRK